MGLNFHSSEDGVVEVSNDSGTTWVKIPGVNSYTETPSPAPERDVVAFEGVGKSIGHPRVPSVELSAIYSPMHKVWDTLRKALESRVLLRFRVTLKEDVFFAIDSAGKTVAIATTGVVSFAGVPKPDLSEETFGPGGAIIVGSKAYIIKEISSAGVATVDPPPGSAVAAATDYKVVSPGIRRPSFVARVASVGDFALGDAEGELTTGVSLAPRGQLPDPIVDPDTL